MGEVFGEGFRGFGGFFLQREAELGKELHVALTALDFFIHDDAVEALAHIDEFVGEVEVGFGDESKAGEDLLDLILGVLNAFADFDFLFAGEEGDLPHLLEIHPDGIVEDVEFGVRFFVAFRGFFWFRALIDIGGIDEFDFNAAELRDNRVDGVRVGDIGGESFLEVVEGDVALFFGQPDEFADFFLDELLGVEFFGALAEEFRGWGGLGGRFL